MAEKATAGQYETYLQYQYHEVIVCGSQHGKLLVSYARLFILPKGKKSLGTCLFRFGSLNLELFCVT